MPQFEQMRFDQLRLERHQRRERMRALRDELNALEATEVDLHQKMVRAQAFDPNQGICPRCSIDDAITSRLIVVTDPLRAEAVMRCARCGWDDSAFS